LPYTYGESKGARRQRSLPDVPGPAWPPIVFDPRLEILPRSTVAWTGEVESGGATWVRANDMSFVRKDQIVPYAKTEFHGIELGGEVTLPVAFFKRVAHTQYRRDPKGHFAPTGETWPRLSWVALTGKTEKRGARTFWETKGGDLWLDARDAAIAVATEPPAASAEHATWIDVAALQGWLVAYEREVPVYATMISAGKLGAVKPDPSAARHQPPATTPLGTYRVTEKLLTTTLQSELDDGSDYVHDEVPWSQRFLDIYLLHTAYWHDQWGEGHSGGCVNLAPADAKWLFGWTEPQLPEGWHSMRVRATEPATAIVIHP
jgi:lipoprotein-anchoring transpeptidase ErfK/SrfK